MRSLISLDIAEIFEPKLASVLANKSNNSCLLSLLTTPSVCVAAISTTPYNLTQNKSIALLTRELAEKIIECNVLLCASAICSGENITIAVIIGIGWYMAQQYEKILKAERCILADYSYEPELVHN